MAVVVDVVLVVMVLGPGSERGRRLWVVPLLRRRRNGRRSPPPSVMPCALHASTRLRKLPACAYTACAVAVCVAVWLWLCVAVAMAVAVRG